MKTGKVMALAGAGVLAVSMMTGCGSSSTASTTAAATTAEAPFGPGYEHSTAAVPEATTSAGPASQSEAQSSVTVPGGAVAPKGPAAGV